LARADSFDAWEADNGGGGGGGVVAEESVLANRMGQRGADDQFDLDAYSQVIGIEFDGRIKSKYVFLITVTV
jgi:hypothetical protein